MKQKPSKVQFIEAFKKYAKDEGFDCILRHYHEFKTENWFGERMFVFQWQDGQIERKDTYHFNGKDLTMFSSQKRYDYGARWLDEQ